MPKTQLIKNFETTFLIKLKIVKEILILYKWKCYLVQDSMENSINTAPKNKKIKLSIWTRNLLLDIYSVNRTN